MWVSMRSNQPELLRNMQNTSAVMAFIGCLFLLSGCVDGPLYALKRVNPYYTAQWKKDREHGPTYDDRYDELIFVKSRLPAMDPAEQAEWSTRLASIVQNDVSAEMRSQAVGAIAGLKTPEATKALNAASSDDVEKVRLAACRAWKLHGGQEAADMLSSIAIRKDETTSVRQAAIASLAALPDANAQSTLARLIDDDSPAIQYQVAQSLGEITGQEYGGDIGAWKQYLASQQPAPSTNSFESGVPEVNFAGSQQPLDSDPPSLASPNLPTLPQLR